MSRRENNWLVPVLGLAAGYWVLTKFVGPVFFRPFNTANYVRRMAVRIETAKIKGKYVEFNISIANPNNGPMVVSSVVGKLFLNSWPLGRVNNFGMNGKPLTVIQPNSESRVNVIVKMDAVNAMNMLANAMNTITNKQKQQVLTFQGTVNADRRPWPVNESIKLI